MIKYINFHVSNLLNANKLKNGNGQFIDTKPIKVACKAVKTVKYTKNTTSYKCSSNYIKLKINT